MKVYRNQDLISLEPREKWDSDLFSYLFKLRHHFIVAKLAGLNDFPHKLLRDEISSFGVVWSHLVCAASFAMSLQAIAFFCVPSVVPDNYVPLKLNAKGDPIRYLLPLFSVTLTMLRCRAAVLLSKRTFLAEFRQIAFDIINDPVLCRLKVHPWKLRAYMCAATGTILFGAMTSILSSVAFGPDEWKSLMFYANILESQTYITVHLNVAFYILFVGFHVVLPLLRMTASEFEEAARTINFRRLVEAIRCHQTCCRLIGAVDRIASYYLGAIMIIGVPQISLTISSFDKIAQNSTSLNNAVVNLSWQSFLIATFLLLASKIHQEAHRPREILAVRVCRNKDFDCLSSQFLRRFDKKDFGFSFFGFFTFRRETVLRVLNIITTYLIVALQMKPF